MTAYDVFVFLGTVYAAAGAVLAVCTAVARMDGQRRGGGRP